MAPTRAKAADDQKGAAARLESRRFTASAIALVGAIFLVLGSGLGTVAVRMAAPAKAPTAQDDLVLAQAVIVQAADLSPGWTLEASTIDGVSELHSPNTCVGTKPATNTAGIGRDFAFNLQPNGRESGHLYTRVVVDVDSSHARQAWRERATSPRYPGCIEQAVDGDLAATGGGIEIFGRGTPLKAHQRLPVTGDVYELTTWFRIGNSPLTQWITTLVDLVHGRVRAQLRFQRCTCSGAPAPAYERDVIKAVAGRMVRLQR